MGLWSKGIKRSVTGESRLGEINEPKHKPGDKVKVKPYSWYIENRRPNFSNNLYIIPEHISGIEFIQEMSKFCDMTVTIDCVEYTDYGYYYLICEDERGCYMWHDNMFQTHQKTREEYLENKI